MLYGSISGLSAPWLRWLLAASLCLISSAGVSRAEGLGWAIGVTNDSIGEFRDRWQSSSVEAGFLFGALNDDAIPTQFGRVNELRFRSDILTPELLDVIVPTDRRHAGVLTAGLHSYAARGAWIKRVGVDVVAVGPQTGMYSFQQELHELLGFTIPQLEGFQIEDTVRLDVSGEVAREVPVAFGHVRPFISAKVGTEDFLRVGADVYFGAFDRLAMRTVTSGHRLPFGASEVSWGISFGADAAWVTDSLFLPEHLGYELTNPRVRARGGIRYGSPNFDVFYGLTYLGREFQAQSEGQFVGTLQLEVRF